MNSHVDTTYSPTEDGTRESAISTTTETTTLVVEPRLGQESSSQLMPVLQPTIVPPYYPAQPMSPALGSHTGLQSQIMRQSPRIGIPPPRPWPLSPTPVQQPYSTAFFGSGPQPRPIQDYNYGMYTCFFYKSNILKYFLILYKFLSLEMLETKPLPAHVTKKAFWT